MKESHFSWSEDFIFDVMKSTLLTGLARVWFEAVW